MCHQPMETAPRNELIRLLVDFTDNATDDTPEPTWTIGFYSDAEEKWHMAGWCWTHDHFTAGEGTPVGWLPLVPEANA